MVSMVEMDFVHPQHELLLREKPEETPGFACKDPCLDPGRHLAIRGDGRNALHLLKKGFSVKTCRLSSKEWGMADIAAPPAKPEQGDTGYPPPCAKGQAVLVVAHLTSEKKEGEDPGDLQVPSKRVPEDSAEQNPR